MPETVLSELEACSFRNKSPEETAEYMKSILEKYLPLRSDSSRSQKLQEERRRDHYSHFILRLAFSSTEDLRRRFSRLETMLFTLRFKDDDLRERQEFVRSLNLEWEEVREDEKRELREDLHAASGMKKGEDQEWFKVDWERVPELVSQRKVLLKRGKAYVPQREQMSLVVAEFTKKLDEALEVTTLPSLSPQNKVTNDCLANSTRPPSPRRRRPPCPHTRPPLSILHRPRRRIHHRRRQHLRPQHHNRCFHRHPVPKLPPVHAQLTHDTARPIAPEALWPAPIHPVPQRHRPESRRMSRLLAALLQTDNRREVSKRIQIQHPTFLRRRGRRRKQARTRLHPLLVSKTPHGAATRSGTVPRVPLPHLHAGQLALDASARWRK